MKVKGIFVAIFIALFGFYGAADAFFGGGAKNELYDIDIDEDGFGYVDENDWLLEDVTLDRSATIVNRGVIGASIIVAENCDLIIQNSGNIDAPIQLGKGAHLTQLIKSTKDITQILVDQGVSYDISVEATDKLSLDDIVALRTGADVNNIILNGGMFTIDDIAGVRDAGLVFTGHVELFLNGIADLEDGLLIRMSGASDVSGVKDGLLINLAGSSGDVYIHLENDANADRLFVMHAYMNDEGLMIEHLRNTDYSDIMDNNLGEFLDALRESGAANKMLARLDAAQSWAEINAILARSARVNPINLMRPIRVLDLSVQNSAHFDENESAVNIAPMYLGADGLDIFGVRGDLFARFSDRFSMALDGYVARGSYEDDIDDYDIDIYGGNISANYDANLFFVRGLFGASYAEFDIGPVFDGTGAVYNPNGLSLYGFADAGHKFDITRDIYVSPFVGFGARKDKVLNQSEHDAFMRFGTDAGVLLDYGDLRYDYGLRVHGTSGGDVAVDVNIGAWSVIDAAGVNISAGIVNYDDITAYTVSAGVRFQF